MKSITAKQGRELVNDANAEGEGIGFSNLEELSPEVAAELVKSPGSLYLSLSLPTVSAKTAVVLAQHQGGLDLTLQTLSLEAAFALAQHENELRIWLDKPTSSVVSALAKHQGQIDLGFEEAEVENLHEAFYEERERFLNEKRAAGSRNQK